MRGAWMLAVVVLSLLVTAGLAVAESPWTEQEGYANRAGGKFGYGLENTALGWTEIFSEPVESGKQKENIANHPALVLWGLKDDALPRKMMQNWSLLFTRLKLLSFEDAGHFVMEDKGAELVPIVEDFLRNPPVKG